MYSPVFCREEWFNNHTKAEKEKREFLACNNLIGKIQLTSAMSEAEIFEGL